MINLRHIASPRRWRVANPSPRRGEIEIAGWDFGGEGPLALLHHANGMCAATWALVAKSLTDRFRVVAVDARGHGDSEHLRVPQDYDWRFFVSDLAAVAAELLKETGQPRVGLGLGSSFGGIITAGAEAAHNGLFERILMLDPPIHPTPELAASLGYALPPESSSGRAQLVEQTLKRRATWDSREQAREAWRNKALFAPWHDAAFDLYLSEGLSDQSDGTVALKCSPAVEAHIFESTGSFGPEEYAPKVHIPARITRATQGHFPADFFKLVTGLFPRGDYRELEGGHMLPLEVPDRVVDHVFDWVDATND